MDEAPRGDQFWSPISSGRVAAIITTGGILAATRRWIGYSATKPSSEQCIARSSTQLGGGAGTSGRSPITTTLRCATTARHSSGTEITTVRHRKLSTICRGTSVDQPRATLSAKRQQPLQEPKRWRQAPLGAPLRLPRQSVGDMQTTEGAETPRQSGMHTVPVPPRQTKTRRGQCSQGSAGFT